MNTVLNEACGNLGAQSIFVVKKSMTLVCFEEWYKHRNLVILNLIFSSLNYGIMPKKKDWATSPTS